MEESEDNCLKKDLFVAKIAEIQYSSFHVKCNLCKILSGNWGSISGGYSFLSQSFVFEKLPRAYFVAK